MSTRPEPVFHEDGVFLARDDRAYAVFLRLDVVAGGESSRVDGVPIDDFPAAVAGSGARLNRLLHVGDAVSSFYNFGGKLDDLRAVIDAYDDVERPDRGPYTHVATRVEAARHHVRHDPGTDTYLWVTEGESTVRLTPAEVAGYLAGCAAARNGRPEGPPPPGSDPEDADGQAQVL
jgi:hypothetical protein